MTPLYNGDTFDHKGYRFRYRCEIDEDMQEPWKEHDGHGIISEWTTRGKAPGERILATDRSSHRYYDVAGTLQLARKDGWGITRPGTKGDQRTDYEPLPGESKRAYTARAVEHDFERMRDWCDDKWHWCYISVTLLDKQGEETTEREGLGGIDGDDQDEYLAASARELADQIIARIEVETPGCAAVGELNDQTGTLDQAYWPSAEADPRPVPPPRGRHGRNLPRLRGGAGELRARREEVPLSRLSGPRGVRHRGAARAGRSGDHLMINEPHLLGPRVVGTQTRYCFNSAHGTPCPLPCRQCQMECPRKEWEDTATNRQRTLEWEARRPRS